MALHSVASRSASDGTWKMTTTCQIAGLKRQHRAKIHRSPTAIGPYLSFLTLLFGTLLCALHNQIITYAKKGVGMFTRRFSVSVSRLTQNVDEF